MRLFFQVNPTYVKLTTRARCSAPAALKTVASAGEVPLPTPPPPPPPSALRDRRRRVIVVPSDVSSVESTESDVPTTPPQKQGVLKAKTPLRILKSALLL